MAASPGDMSHDKQCFAAFYCLLAGIWIHRPNIFVIENKFLTFSLYFNMKYLFIVLEDESMINQIVCTLIN